MTEEEKEEVKRDLEKSVKISFRLAENVINQIEKKLKKGDNVTRMTAMILHNTTSMLMASTISIHRQIAGLDQDTITNMMSNLIENAIKMESTGGIKAFSQRQH
ncbi:MAG: hypothetical protein KBD78_16995 [Oligoflexales bacterium]|nr:hypothetical protein [Oligoflexales bacterium]